jgi:hypothetical protein
MAELRKRACLNHTGKIPFLPSPLPYSDPAAANEYDAATVSSMVFGIFMALLTLYMFWQQCKQWKGIYLY